MRVIASSVIRSAYKGSSHGGLYIIDFDKQKSEQVLDWNYPHIRWDSGGGDRGLRGMVFYKDYLYASGATYIYKFNKNFELINKFHHECFGGTHEMCRDGEILFTISNEYDAIWWFSLEEERWIGGFQHILGKNPTIFSPDEEITKSDTMHIDTISYKNGYIWYAGSTTKYLYGFDAFENKLESIKLFYPNTHNAQFFKDGIIFNRAIEGETCYQVGNELIKTWKTPVFNKYMLINNLNGDYARTEYTRGMAIDGENIAIGTSPATVHLLSLNTDEILSCNLSLDIRNSICGLSICPWEI